MRLGRACAILSCRKLVGVPMALSGAGGDCHSFRQRGRKKEPDMRVMRARNAGFCMGVALALHKLDEAVAAAPGRVATLGAIIHNPQVLAEYAAKGVRVLHSADEAEPDMTVVVRAHGIPRKDEARLSAIGAAVVDATCPRVKKAQISIAEATANGAVVRRCRASRGARPFVLCVRP